MMDIMKALEAQVFTYVMLHLFRVNVIVPNNVDPYTRTFRSARLISGYNGTIDNTAAGSVISDARG